MVNELPASVYHRIAEAVTKLLGVDVSDIDVHEILHARTIGWKDDVVAAVQMEAANYTTAGEK